MASVEFIQKRIAGKEKELEKLNKKLARIRMVEAQNWEDPNPYYYSEHDLRYCLKDIEAAEKALEDYKMQLAAEIEKANSRNVKVIVDFLEMWKHRVREFYKTGLVEYYEERESVRAAFKVAETLGWTHPEYKEAYAKATKMQKAFRINCHGKYEYRTVIDRRGRERKEEVKVAAGKYEYLNSYTGESTFEKALARLEKELVQEANRKYDFIIERTNRIVGTITDASHLMIGDKDDLNGYIIGTRGTAKVQTVGAGGYNIQCYHFRTLINAMN